jgi:hypothetical protein
MDKSIKSVFEQFFTVIAEKYELDREKVKKACLTSHKKQEVRLTKENVNLVEQAKEFLSKENLAGKLTVDKLKEMCRVKGLKLNGKKEDLIRRLENPNIAANKAGNISRKKKSLFKPADLSKIVEKLRGPISKLAVRKNAQGFYVHHETNLVFDPSSHKAIGKWKDDQVKWLTKQDVETCIKLGVLYELPENLDLGLVKVFDKKVEEVLGDEDFKDETDEDKESDDEDETAED